MKRWIKILLGTTVAISVLVAGILMLSVDVNVARQVGETTFLYEGEHYNLQKFQHKRGKRLGGIEHLKQQTFEFKPLASDGVYAVEGDDNQNFLFITYGFRAMKGCYVRDGVEIPMSGAVTEVYNNYSQSTTNSADIAMFERIVKLSGEMTEFMVDGLASSQRKFYFAYDNCPVAAHTPGSIVYADGNLLFVKEGDTSYDPEDWWSGTGKGIVITEPDLLEFILANSWALLPGSYED